MTLTNSHAATLRRSAILSSISLGALALAGAFGEASAQEIAPPPVRSNVDERGVDVVTGQYHAARRPPRTPMTPRRCFPG